jgi:hypothetical protein
MICRFMMLICLLVLLAGCQSRPDPAPSGAGSVAVPGAPTTLEDQIVDGPVPGCVDAVEMVGQTLTLPMTLILDAGGVIDRVGIVAVGGTYVFSTRPVNPFNCASLPEVPSVGPITVNFGFNYLGDFSRVNPLCINGSSIDFTAFSVTGSPLDLLVENAAREQIWRETDREVAERFHGMLNGTPFPATASARCVNWIDLATLP